ncbi:hypothetical protein BCR36DRAFT_404165 [Piromyces finnis]|uniref:Uncharacterized protein n=1 Tax=Piromyces finnis TaxID=1754191 RepID=A0A1Y1VCX9_9FUNG|nr:hypothetical protein BCR36DRAFT_404165 [Piromyces finnis]|eukprot:ORX51519.1 hypothetical protein BCR36DRAFT_404165 [Piromyces finnis]
MDSQNVDDSYLRATRSARIERMKNIIPVERKAPNTVSNIRMSNIIHNRNDITPSHSNKIGIRHSNHETWSTPSRKSTNIAHDFNSRNLVFDEEINNSNNKTRNDILYKSALDDEEYVDNEDDIFNFSRINRKNENTPHFQKLNKEISNYVMRNTSMSNESSLSTNGPSLSYSIFTTPLAKETAEHFGMTVSESNRQRRYSYSSLNAIKESLYVTPKKSTKKSDMLKDGSKSVNYINKMNYSFSANKITMNKNDNDNNNKEKDYSSPSKIKETEKETENNIIVIPDDKINNEVEKVNSKVQASSANDINIQLTTPKKSNISLINSSESKNKTKSVLGTDFKLITPNKPTVNFDTYITPTSLSITQGNTTTTPLTQNKQRLFHDSLLTRKSFSANPTRIQRIINKSMKTLNSKHRNLFNNPSHSKKSVSSNNSPLKKRSMKMNTTSTSMKKSTINTYSSYLSNETPTHSPVLNNNQYKGNASVSTSKSQNSKPKSITATTSNVDSTFINDQSKKPYHNTSLSLRDIDSKYEYLNDKITPIKQKFSDISSTSPIVTTTTVTKKLGNITKIGVPPKEISPSSNKEGNINRRRRSRSHSRRRKSSVKNLKDNNGNGVLIELKRKVDPITGIISELSVVEDPDTGETTRIITSYDPVTGNKSETKTITTTTTTMTTTTQSTTTRKTTTIDREEEEEETEDDFDNISENDNENSMNESGYIEYSSSLNSEDEGDNIFTKLHDTHSDSDFDQQSLVSNDLDAPPSLNPENSSQKHNREQTLEYTPQNKTSVKDNTRKIGTYSVPTLHRNKYRLEDTISLDNPPYTIYSKGRSDQDHQSFNNVPTVGRLSLSNIDLNSPKYNDKDNLSNYYVSKNKLDLSMLKKQYKLEQEINDNILNNAKPKSKIAECEEAIGNLLSKWTKEDEEKEKIETHEENEEDSLTFNTNIKEIKEEIQRRIEKNKKLNEEINNKSLQFNLKQQQQQAEPNDKKIVTINIEDDEMEEEKEEKENHDDMNSNVEVNDSEIKPASHPLPDFILSSNRSTPSRLSSTEILSSKKSSQLIQRLQDDFIKSHKHTRSPGIDFSSYRSSAKKPKLEVDSIDQEDTINNITFQEDQYEDNPFMPNNTHSSTKKQLSIIIDDENEQQPEEPKSIIVSEAEPPKQQPEEPESITISEIEPPKQQSTDFNIIATNTINSTSFNINTDTNELLHTPKQTKTPKKDEHLESIKKKLSEHSLYVKELKEGIRNKLNKSKLFATDPSQDQTKDIKNDTETTNNSNEEDDNSITIAEPKEPLISSSLSTSLLGLKHHISEEDGNHEENVEKPNPKRFHDLESSQENSIVIAATNTVNESDNVDNNKDVNNNLDVEIIEAILKNSDQVSPLNHSKTESNPLEENGQDPENEDTLLDFERISQFHANSISNSDKNTIIENKPEIIVIDSYQPTENLSNSNILDGDEITEGTSNAQREVMSFEDSASVNGEFSDENSEKDTNSNQEEKVEEDNEINSNKVMSEESHEDNEVYFIHLDKSPQKSSSVNYTLNEALNDDNNLEKDDSLDQSPLSKKEALASQPCHDKSYSSFEENEIIKMNKPVGTEMDIDIISIGDSSNDSHHEEEEKERSKKETTPEVEESFSIVEMNSSEEEDNTIIFSSGNTTPTKINKSWNNTKEINNPN